MPLTGDRHLSEEQLIWHYYGEEDAAEVDLHLAVCRECRSAFTALQVEMKSIEAWPAPPRAADYGEEVWRGLVRRNAAIGARLPWWRRWSSPKVFAWATAAACVLLAVFFAGRATRPEPEIARSPEAVRERILAAALSDHLESSERVLLEVSHLDSTGGLAPSRPRAEELLAANRLYRATAERQGQEALAGVLDDLERVLLDVARSPDRLSNDDMSRLRARVEDQELLFKVRVLSERLRQMNSPRKG